MGTPKLLFPGRRVSANKVISASSQGTVRPLQPQQGKSNVGSLTLSASGKPVSAVDQRVEVVGEGSTADATYKLSLDGGTTYLGRMLLTTFDGNGAATRSIISETANPLCSKPVSCDTDNDGIDDAVLIATHDGASAPVKILKTTDYAAGATWVSVCASATGGNVDNSGNNPVLVRRGSELFLFTAMNGAVWSCRRSIDWGITWGSASTVISDASGGDAIVLASGKLLFSTIVTISTHPHPVCKSSSDGVTWSAQKQISAAGANDHSGNVALAQDSAGRTVAFFFRYSGTANGVIRQCTNVDPAASSATWGASDETVWTDTTFQHYSAAIAPDGTIVVIGAKSTDIYYTYIKGVGTFPAPAVALSSGGDSYINPMVANIGGALWVPFQDTTNDDVLLCMSKYWTTYSAGNESWMGTTPQYIADSIWYTWGGTLGKTGDYFDVGSVFVADAGNMVRYIRNRPAQSSNDLADWDVVFDAGVNNVFAVNTACVMGNFDHCHLQFHETDSWGSLSADENQEISLVKATYAATTGYTLPGGGRIKFTAGGLVPRSLVGYSVRFSGGTLTYEIADNDSDEAYIDGLDVDGETGTMTLIAPRAWKSFTTQRYRYMRLLIETQDTAAGVFSVPALVVGIATNLTANDVVQEAHTEALDVKRFPSGQAIRVKNGDALRSFNLVLSGATEALKDEIVNQLRVHDYGVAPFALIPDSANAFDWAVVAPPDGRFDPSAVYQFALALEEIV